MEEEDDDDIYGSEQVPRPGSAGPTGNGVKYPDAGNGDNAVEDEEEGEEVDEDGSDSVHNLSCLPCICIN